MNGKLNISLGTTFSDSKIMVGDQQIEGVQKVEMIAERGKLTQVMLVLSPGYVTIDSPVWDIEGETAKNLANTIALELGTTSFVERIYNAILSNLKGAK